MGGIGKPRQLKNETIDDVFGQNPILWGFNYFPHHFRSASPRFHVKIIENVLTNRYFACQCPRESAKSTLLSFLYVSHRISFKRKRFVVIVQNTYQKAAETLNTIKSEFRNNQQLESKYRVEITKDSTGDSIFRHPDGFQTRVLCKGAEQIGSVRGEKFGAYRPDLILIDDLEDDEMVRSPERRRNLQDLYDNALVPAGDAETCQYIAIGTILHDDCLMAKLVSPNFYKEYTKLFYRALYTDKVTGKWRSLWKEKWSVKRLFNIRATRPDVFAKEYQGNPVSGSLRKFDKEDFRRWYIEDDCYVLLDGENRTQTKGRLVDCKAAIGCDLAWEETKSADFSVALPMLITPQANLLIDDYFCERGVRPDQFEEIIFKMEEKYRKLTGKGVTIGFEKGKIEKVMKWFLAQAMRRRNQYLNIKDVPWVHDKIARIVTPLQPRYKMHTVFHKSGMGELEYQLLRVPSGTHEDLPDAEQMACRLLEYAPTVKKTTTTEGEDPMFDWLMKKQRAKKKKEKGGARYIFGQKSTKLTELPARESWR